MATNHTTNQTPALGACRTLGKPGPVKYKIDLRDVTQNTLFRVDTLTDRGVDLSRRQGKPGQDAKATAETAPVST